MANKPDIQPQNTEIETVKQLFDTAKNRVRRMFMRLGFHFIAFVSAALLSTTVTATTFPYKLDDTRESSGVLMYLSLLVIFPRRNQPVNSAIAVLTSVLWCFFGPWQIALAWGAAQRILLDIIETKTLFHWRKIGTLFLCLVIFIFFFELNPISFVSSGFLALFVICTVIGVFIKPYYERYQQLKVMKPIKPIADKPMPETKNTNNRLDIYEKLVDELLMQSKVLPENLARHVVDICEQTESIMYSMTTDPRDFEPGDKFLKRYLVAVQKIIAQSQKLLNSAVSTPDVENALNESETLLIRLSGAFTELQTRLLENDMQDLTIELNVLDKLLKMEGYK